MKLVSYCLNDGVPRWGVIVDSSNRYVADGIDLTDGRYHSVREILQADAVDDIRAALPTAASRHLLHDVRLLPPVTDPQKILAIGYNYRAHATESAQEEPTAPVFFARFSNTLVGADGHIVRPRVSEQLDFEGELAVVLGRGGRHISEATAMQHVAGYACFNDASVRDYQKESITAGKNFMATAPFGPWLVTIDEIPDPSGLSLVTRLNGRIVQEGHTSQWLFSIASLIAYASRFTRLEAGDIIATGTPAGIGARRKPPLWLRAGDIVEVEISGVGTLRNTVVDEN